MNTFYDQLSAEGTRERAAFSRERHARLLVAVRCVPNRRAEAPLKPVPEVRWAAFAAVLVCASTIFMWTGRGDRVARSARHIGAPMFLAEETLAAAHGAMERIPPTSADPLLEPTEDVVRFFARQVSMTRSLAAASGNKTPA